MPVPTFSGLPPFPTFDDVTEKLNRLVNEMRNLLLNLDTLNIAELNAEVIIANTITADKMNVNELSAITANLGHIISGLIETVKMIGSEIYGSYIATAEGSYPRAEMSSDEDLFAAYATADNFLKIYAIESGTPMVYFSNPSSVARLFLNGSNLSLANFGTMLLSATGDLTIESTSPTSNLKLKAGSNGNVTVDSWSRFSSTGDGQSLQTALNGKANAFSGASGSFETADGKTVTVSNGIITSVV